MEKSNISQHQPNVEEHMSQHCKMEKRIKLRSASSSEEENLIWASNTMEKMVGHGPAPPNEEEDSS